MEAITRCSGAALKPSERKLTCCAKRFGVRRLGRRFRKRNNKMQRHSVAIVCVFLTAITWFVFGQTVRYDFVNYDDDNYVYANPLIRSGLTVPGAIHAFIGKHAGNWHPLTTLSHMLDCQIWGLHAAGHNLTNIVLHTIAVV